MNMAVNPATGDAAIEQLIREKGADVAPRVPLSRIEELQSSLIAHYHHFPDTTIIVCILTLPNGFEVGLGKAAAISKENFNVEIGRKIAHQNALTAATQKLWELEGYLLRSKL